MANWLIAFFIGLSASVWVYTKLMRKTGNNSQSSIMAAGVTGLLLFVVSLMALSMFSAK